MATCRTCSFSTAECICGSAGNDNSKFDIAFIRLPQDSALAQASAYHRLAMAYRSKNLSRRSMLNHLVNALVGFQGIVIDAKGQRIDVPEIDVDEIFRTDADPSERWISSFLRAGVTKPQREAQARIIPRLRVLWLVLAITNRAQAEMAVK